MPKHKCDLSRSELEAARDWSPISTGRLPKIIEVVSAWRLALTQFDDRAAQDARQLFLARTMSLQRGRMGERMDQHGHSPTGEQVDQLPLGRPQLEGALYHLRQLAYAGGGTDRAATEAINDVLRLNGGGTAKPKRRRSANGDAATKPWLTVSEAETVSGIPAATISQLATAEKLKSNGKTRRERRISSADLNRYMLERNERNESTTAIQGKLANAQLPRN